MKKYTKFSVFRIQISEKAFDAAPYLNSEN
jgi:hypothetical protein